MELESAGKIERVTATDLYSIPFLVDKKTAPFHRMVIDYQPPNSFIDAPVSEFVPPQQLLDGIHDSTIFSVIDLKAAFHQVDLAADSRDATTFRTPFGFYRYTVLPFGLNISPEIFHRTLLDLFGNSPFVKYYMDDILVFSHTAE